MTDRLNPTARLGIVLALAFSCTAYAGAAFSGKADVTAVTVVQTAPGIYRFDVTVKHADTGWSHYADRWDVVGPDGTVLGSRTLYHPHVNEQPFTRSLGGVKIPAGVTEVTVRAHDSQHKLGGAERTVTLPR